MNINEVYNKAIGAEQKEETINQEEIIKQKQIELQHAEWLKDPMTVDYFRTMDTFYTNYITIAQNQAISGNDASAARLLIKAKTINEILTYGRTRKSITGS